MKVKESIFTLFLPRCRWNLTSANSAFKSRSIQYLILLLNKGMKHRDCMHKLFLTVPKGQGEKECGMHKMSSSTSVKTPVFMCIRGYVTFHLSAKWSGYHKGWERCWLFCSLWPTCSCEACVLLSLTKYTKYTCNLLCVCVSQKGTLLRTKRSMVQSGCHRHSKHETPIMAKKPPSHIKTYTVLNCWGLKTTQLSGCIIHWH